MGLLDTQYLKQTKGEVMDKEFEQWMKDTFEEPEWDEGWTRNDMQKAYESGVQAERDKAVTALKETLTRISDYIKNPDYDEDIVALGIKTLLEKLGTLKRGI